MELTAKIEELLPRLEAVWKDMAADSFNRPIGSWCNAVSDASDLIKELSAALSEPREPVASSACPMCGVDTPHAHNQAQVIEWLRIQAKRFYTWGEIAIVSPTMQGREVGRLVSDKHGRHYTIGLKPTEGGLDAELMRLENNGKLDAGSVQSQAVYLASTPGDVEKAPAYGVATHGPWLIYYDDRDRQPEVFTDKDAARRRYVDISGQWNAHLFERVHTNSRDAEHVSPPSDVEKALEREIERLKGGLRWYAERNHMIGLSTDWDEEEGWMCPPNDESWMVEPGHVAQAVLDGGTINPNSEDELLVLAAHIGANPHPTPHADSAGPGERTEIVPGIRPLFTRVLGGNAFTIIYQDERKDQRRKDFSPRHPLSNERRNVYRRSNPDRRQPKPSTAGEK